MIDEKNPNPRTITLLIAKALLLIPNSVATDVWNILARATAARPNNEILVRIAMTIHQP